MDSNRVVVVLVSGHGIQIVCGCWSELYVDVFRYSSRNHALF
jgi:hypothetical protein